MLWRWFNRVGIPFRRKPRRGQRLSNGLISQTWCPRFYFLRLQIDGVGRLMVSTLSPWARLGRKLMKIFLLSRIQWLDGATLRLLKLMFWLGVFFWTNYLLGITYFKEGLRLILFFALFVRRKLRLIHTCSLSVTWQGLIESCLHMVECSYAYFVFSKIGLPRLATNVVFNLSRFSRGVLFHSLVVDLVF